jgi:hypothetical protein
MNIQYTHIKNIFFYTGLETALYQVMLVAHQIMLYHYVQTSFYGIISAIFSVIYIATLHVNLGLDLSFAPLFNIHRNSCAYFKQITQQIIANMLYGLVATFIIYHMRDHISYLTSSQLIICCLLVISETTKKSLKSILHLLLAHRYIMAVELTTLCLYIITVWSLFIWGYTPSITIIFLPMLGISSLAVCMYGYLYTVRYFTLKTTSTDISKPATSYLRTLRLQHYIYQIIHSVYSPNFLVSLIAVQYDIELAAVLKIVSIGLYAINNMIRYAFGITSSVLFSHIKNMYVHEKEAIFTLLHRYLYKTLLLTSILFCVHHYIFLKHVTYHHLTIIYLFLLLILSEDVTIAYEHFFIIEEQTVFLIACYTAIMLPTLLLKGLHYDHIEHLFIILISMRGLYLVVIHYYKQYYFLHLASAKKELYNKLTS